MRAAGRRATTPAARASAAPATSTTRRSRRRRCGHTARSRCSTSTRTTATGRRRSSGSEPGVAVASVHVDPGAGWFPHFLGFADETGEGANLNLPLAPGAGDDQWLAAVRKAAEWIDADALVVSLGVDAAAADPESPLQVSSDAFHEAGRIIGGLGLPTVLVQEGGYDLETLGSLTLEVLRGVESAR